MSAIGYKLFDTNAGIANVTQKGNIFTFNYPCKSTIACTPYVVSLSKGSYKFSLWGAQGGNSRKLNSEEMQNDAGGKGAFLSGIIKLRTDKTMYLYVGGKGEDLTSIDANAYGRGGFNGGGDGGYDVDENKGESGSGGGGSSDIRLVYGDTIEALKSRIIVAGAGGSAFADQNVGTIKDSNDNYFLLSYIAGDAGAIEGYSNSNLTLPGTQTNGSFGKGMNGISFSPPKIEKRGATGGGGGGYYGGYHIDESSIGSTKYISTAGAGGSSFVSGCSMCSAVKESPLDSIEHSGKGTHFSGLSFTRIVMKSGKETFASPSEQLETGHHGNGAISIQCIFTSTKSCRNQRSTGFLIYLLVVSSS